MDKLDRRILEILDKNSKISLSSIAKLLRKSKQTIGRRIKKLEDENIFSYYLIINYFKLRLFNAVLFLSLNRFDDKILKEKIKTLEEIKSIGWIAHLFGPYDLGISIFYKNIIEINEIISFIENTFGDLIKRKHLELMTKHYLLSLALENEEKSTFIISYEESSSELTPIHLKVLNILTKNVREPYVNIAQKLNISTTDVSYIIKKLEKNRIIIGYKLLFDFNKLGFNWALIRLHVNKSEEAESIIKDIKIEKNVILISKTVNNDLYIDFLYKSILELNNFITICKNKYPVIKDYKIINIIKVYKLSAYLRV